MSTAISELFDNTRSLFIYHPDLKQEVATTLAHKDISKHIKTLTKQEVQYFYDIGYFSLSDLHIARVVAKHVYVTQSMVKKYVDYNNKYADGVHNISIVSDIDSIKKRLTSLVKCGILTRYMFYTRHYEHTDKLLKMSYYLVSPHGYNYLKRILNYKKPYDEYLAIWPIEEVFKYLVVNSVCLNFLHLDEFKNYEVDLPFYVKQLYSKEKIYAVVDLNQENNIKKIIIEPFKLTFNNMRLTEDEFKLELNNRFKILDQYIKNLESDGFIDNDLIFVCEDFKGIKQAAKMASHYLADYLENIYFTTDVMASYYKPEIAYIKLKNTSLISATPTYFLKAKD